MHLRPVLAAFSLIAAGEVAVAASSASSRFPDSIGKAVDRGRFPELAIRCNTALNQALVDEQEGFDFAAHLESGEVGGEYLIAQGRQGAPGIHSIQGRKFRFLAIPDPYVPAIREFVFAVGERKLPSLIELSGPDSTRPVFFELTRSSAMGVANLGRSYTPIELSSNDKVATDLFRRNLIQRIRLLPRKILRNYSPPKTEVEEPRSLRWLRLANVRRILSGLGAVIANCEKAGLWREMDPILILKWEIQSLGIDVRAKYEFSSSTAISLAHSIIEREGEWLFLEPSPRELRRKAVFDWYSKRGRLRDLSDTFRRETDTIGLAPTKLRQDIGDLDREIQERVSDRLNTHLGESTDKDAYAWRYRWLARFIQAVTMGESLEDLRSILSESEVLIQDLADLWTEYLRQSILENRVEKKIH